MISKKLFAFAVSLLFLTATAFAGSGDDQSAGEQAGGLQSTTQSGTQSEQSQYDPQMISKEIVVNHLHHLNQKEMAMAKLAESKSESPALKGAAKQVSDEHANLERQVENYAKTQNIKLQDYQPSTYEKAFMDRLNSLSGSQFDMVYSQAQRIGHSHALQELQFARGEVKDGQLKALISAAIPKLRAHQKASAALSKQLSTQKGGTQQPQQESQKPQSDDHGSMQKGGTHDMGGTGSQSDLGSGATSGSSGSASGGTSTNNP